MGRRSADEAGEAGLVGIELVMLENLGQARRDLARKRGAGGEGVGAGIPHPLGKICRVGVGLDPEVPEHGI